MAEIVLEISEEELKKRASRIRAVYDFPNKGKCYIKPVNLREVGSQAG